MFSFVFFNTLFICSDPKTEGQHQLVCDFQSLLRPSGKAAEVHTARIPVNLQSNLLIGYLKFF